ncbi:MAG: uracil-DNA glycosylase family protein [Saprospiraceae bacterium]
MPTIARLLASHFDALMQSLPPVPEGVEWLLPLKHEPESARVFSKFLKKYYADHQPRTLILGINPGRFGAGITNVAFTDPAHLERECGIENSFPKREELSAQFVYKVVHAYGGVAAFYRKFFINSVVPFGFVRDGKNYNYYDERPLQEAMTPFAIYHIKGMLDSGMNREVCLCLGEGKNFKFLSKLNEKERFFKKVVPFSHPRYIMQYRRKKVDEYVEAYVEAMMNVE